MKTYTDLYIESPRAFLRKLEEDIKSLDKKLQKLDHLATSGLGGLLEEYERLSLVVEQRAYGVTLSDTWSWTAGQDGAVIPNLYAPELTGNAVTYCWTGPDPVTVFEAEIRRDIDLSINVNYLGTVNDVTLAALQLKVDGQYVKAEIADGMLHAVLKKRVKQSMKATEIQLETGETFSPDNEDGRRLGIALVSIQTAPHKED